jgi:hypothetical protein
MAREKLHLLIDRIPEAEISAAQRFLEYLASTTAFRAAILSSPDDEPVTAGDAEGIARALTSKRGELFPTMRSYVNSAADEFCMARDRSRGFARNRSRYGHADPWCADQMRVGDYRVIFSVSPKEIVILRVRHRSDVYR